MSRKKKDQESEPTEITTPSAGEPLPQREPGDEPQRRPFPNPMTWITDNAAGVEYRTNRDPYEAQLRFKDGKPSEEVRQQMKENGFTWKAAEQLWARPIGFNSKAQDEEIGRRVAAKVRAIIREEKGLPEDKQVPF